MSRTRTDIGVLAQPLVGRYVHLASVLVAQARALHAQLPLGQRHHAALGAVPAHRPAGAASLLGAGELLRRTTPATARPAPQRSRASIRRCSLAPLRAVRASATAPGRCWPGQGPEYPRGTRPYAPCRPRQCGAVNEHGRGWRRDRESNPARRICNPLHNRFAIAPCLQSARTYFCCSDKNGKPWLPVLKLERETSLELATSTLARLRSTN